MLSPLPSPLSSHARTSTLATRRLTLTAIMPAYNAALYLPLTLVPLLALRDRGDIDEVILVDDVSSDGTGELARALGARVLQQAQRAGPAAARNLAAQHAQGEVLWFVDADVTVRSDAASRLRQHFARGEITAVFGSYCDSPPAMGFFSQYKNLVHHFHHQRNAGPSNSFWTGCGAVRRPAFLAVGGFDAERFVSPSIEDVEFGFRLSRGGWRIELDPELLCTHHKRWNLGQVLVTDILHRALPWSRLILTCRAPADQLNVNAAERVSAAVAFALLMSMPLAALHTAVPLALPGLLALVALIRNRALTRFFRDRHGTRFAIAALCYHQLYYVYSSVVYSLCWCIQRLSPGDTPRPPSLGASALGSHAVGITPVDFHQQEVNHRHGKV